MITIALTGGGTAGHISPLLAVAEQLGGSARCVVIGTLGGREDELVPQSVPIIYRIPKLPFPRKINGAALAFPLRWVKAFLAVRRALKQAAVDVVVGFGGYTAAPAYLAAWSLRIPLVIHEANAIPGLANRLGARLTHWVGVCFPGTPLPHAEVVGMPLRRQVLTLDRLALGTQARKHFGLRPGTPVLLVTGGSSGARTINETLDRVTGDIVAKGWQVLHLRGPGHDAPDAPPTGVVQVAYTNRMDLALAAADLVISRAGANTVAELGVVGLPAIFVPYHVGNGEQEHNAAFAVSAGAALQVSTPEFTAEWVRSVLLPLLDDRERIASMAAAMEQTANRDGAEIVARWALQAGARRKDDS
ncbi:UDP-N-acetylglucosamine--N-acetylmuramyl-(pentapeptide) pyrophosphoryl-undecaprenol N-acetylglucosamine transferase [Pontimonas salivibrio]|uniref:UDP-N-acetylglucosamine--N-acetylmuramyl-(pentapeptide) pyrophosphoryl-undecaprenol N-acetylglucosamine transferase n=1 Tax=Pontimonas salivibrio TaxID=1159327 RepID=A0A2L2BQK6_9MICO|nr:undecaprenyldiphospho-muramoylpentapeptide beta-N-acetylglucosaminyltransferase [Pontimonas salivibrio]AVG23949.1 UDP-N-acetylglucosamine--N-acetylmuramyl-(pentapeptide) pyrophosphoryl-undecaprenol N-acetylglucosamine transferase [Pontimonas salivibrio]